jgi:hypothetical protein
MYWFIWRTDSMGCAIFCCRAASQSSLLSTSSAFVRPAFSRFKLAAGGRQYRAFNDCACMWTRSLAILAASNKPGSAKKFLPGQFWFRQNSLSIEVESDVQPDVYYCHQLQYLGGGIGVAVQFVVLMPCSFITLSQK